MYKQLIVISFLCLSFIYEVRAVTICQIERSDTSLKEVVVTSFNTGMRWKEVPASVAYIPLKTIQAVAPISLVPIMNTVPGVRMEERSPGSYRLSVRGSLLRSPFGIRNTKVYWNEIPLTDASGNTYLNLINLQQVNQIEIAKGPVASCYGAGTGGALLLNQSMSFDDSLKNTFIIGFSGGSFGLNQQQTEWKHQAKSFVSSLQFNRLQLNGYRQQSGLLKSSLSWLTAFKVNKHVFNSIIFYTDLFYGTPGAITAAQIEQNPTLARLPAGALPGAIQQKTAVYNKTLLGAIKHAYTNAANIQTKSFISIGNTNFTNPFITNFEQRKEVNINAGAQLIIKPCINQPNIQWINGVELLMNESAINNFINNSGTPAAVQSKDVVYSLQNFYFSQIKFPITRQLLATAGFSINHQSYHYKRLTDLNAAFTKRTINAPFIPRLALSYAIHQNITAYTILAEGFSPPSLAEVRPSDGNFYPLLNAEKGWNFEAGIKGFLFNKRLTFDLAGYHFKLNDAIVRRIDNAGVEYFINAGSTQQNGLEMFLQYQLLQKNRSFIEGVSISNSLSYQPYRFTNYQQGTVNYSGNQLTGVPELVNVSAIQIIAEKGWQLNTSLNITSSIPLNDANTVFAAPYQLLQSKLSKQFNFHNNQIGIYFAGDNLLNQLYSLGNDINAAGNRYFNPAPVRNWIAGIQFSFH